LCWVDLPWHHGLLNVTVLKQSMLSVGHRSNAKIKAYVRLNAFSLKVFNSLPELNTLPELKNI